MFEKQNAVTNTIHVYLTTQRSCRRHKEGATGVDGPTPDRLTERKQEQLRTVKTGAPVSLLSVELQFNANAYVK